MPQAEPATILSRCRAELATMRETIGAGSLDTEDLRTAVRQLASLTGSMAELAGQLAVRTETDLPSLTGSPSLRATVRDIAADLRTTAQHLTTATVLLEPAVADLIHLSTTKSRNSGSTVEGAEGGDAGSAGFGGVQAEAAGVAQVVPDVRLGFVHFGQ